MAPRSPEVSFVETMRGTLASEAVPSCPVELEVIAEAASLRDFRETGWLELRGLLRAPAWIDEAPIRGSLRITARSLVYRVRFSDRRGAALELEGIKRPSVLSPLRSMTQMVAEVRDAEARVLSRGSMHFDPGDVPAFALSFVAWLPSSRRARSVLDARRLEQERCAIEPGRGLIPGLNLGRGAS